MARARRATASWPSRYDTLGNSTESFIAAGGYHHTWNEAEMRILVVEDERKVASFIRQGLEEEGHTVEVAADGAAALDLMVAGPPHDLVVLDLMLPKRDGFEVLRQARSKHVETPVLVLTARDGVSDRVMGLDLGADDYLTKPFAFEEFLARVRALLRRRSASRAPVLRLADLTLDPSTREVTRGQRKLALTAREYALLEYFMRNVGRVLTRPMIAEHVWGLDFDPESNIIDVYVGYLSCSAPHPTTSSSSSSTPRSISDSAHCRAPSARCRSPRKRAITRAGACPPSRRSSCRTRSGCGW